MYVYLKHSDYSVWPITLLAFGVFLSIVFTSYRLYAALPWVVTSAVLMTMSMDGIFLINTALVALILLRGVLDRFRKPLIALFILLTLVKMFVMIDYYLEEKFTYIYYIVDGVFTTLSIVLYPYNRRIPDVKRATWPAALASVFMTSTATPLSVVAGVTLALGELPHYVIIAVMAANGVYLYLTGDAFFYLPPTALVLAYFATYRRLTHTSQTPPLGWLYSWLGGRYKVVKLLGAGGFSYVLAVKHGRETYAAKVLRYSDDAGVPLAGDENVLAAFGQEMNRYLGIKSPHVVRAFEVYLPAVAYRDLAMYMKNPPYILLEYMDGGTLRDLLRVRKKLPTHEALEIFRQLAVGLYDIHKHRVVHLDIKPENILFKNGVAKIGDMGIAKVVVGGYVRSSYMSPAYAAPEVKKGRATLASDIYSLGCVMYEILTGINPNVFVESGHEIPHPSAYNREVPRWLGDFLLKMLSLNPAERPTAGDLITFFKESV